LGLQLYFDIIKVMVNDIRPSNPKRPVEKVAKPLPKKVPVASDEPAFIPPDSLKDNEPNEPKINLSTLVKPDSKSPDFGKNTKADKKKVLSTSRNPFVWLKTKWKGLSKRGKIITVLILLILVGGAVGAAVMFWPEPPPPPKPAPVVEKKIEPPKPTTEASKLTGLQVGFDINKRPVTAVMIENSPDARPQSGLLDAGVVFEAVAEGGITRFLALFQDTNPAYVGPVRSARPYYIRWMLSFDANYAHAGGSPEALNMIRALGVKDLDHGANGSTYDRVSNRYAPHNLYTSIDRLLAAGASRGYNSSTYTGFVRKAEKKVETPTASAIDIAISSQLYNVHYTYDTAGNSYLRNQAGQAHTDEKSGKQLNPKIVVVLVTDKGFDPDGVHTTYRITGSGTAIVFQDGEVISGTWSKAGDKDALLFKDSTGQDLKLNPGQTWITAVGNASAVTYTP
jgi:hypothetical protein